MLNNALKKVFGDRNQRLLKKMSKTAAQINALEPQIQELDDDALIEGRQLRRKALDIVKQCQSFNNWPGHTDDHVQTISLPSWGYAA